MSEREKNMLDSDVPFRLMNYQQPRTNTVHVGIAFGERIIPLEALAALHPVAQRLQADAAASVLTPGVQGLLTNWSQSFQDLSDVARFVTRQGVENGPWREEMFTLEDREVLSPVVRPTKLLFAGANYERHVKQVENWEGLERKGPPAFKIDKATTKPYMFVKLPYCIIGPHGSLVYPGSYQRLDWEVELGFVIGRRGKHISVENAMDYVAGFLTVNDYSLRELNIRKDWPHFGTDWFGGKNFDTAACLGPYLVPKQFVSNYLDLHLFLQVNGETKQDSSTRDMIFKPAEMIAFASSLTTLEPGDVIATGSPEGAGFATGKFLQVGDIIETEVEGLGRQRTIVVEDK